MLMISDLQRLSEIPDTPTNPMFRQLRDAVKLHLRNEPDNSSGVVGPRKVGSQFYSWTVSYLDSGIGQQYWGPGTEGKWKLEEDRTHIVDFFRRLVVILAAKERKYRASITVRRTRNTQAELEEDEEEDEEGYGGWDEECDFSDDDDNDDDDEEEGEEEEEEEESINGNELEELDGSRLEIQDKPENRYLEEANQNKGDAKEPYEPRPLSARISSIREGLRSFKAVAADKFVGPELSGASNLLSSIRKYAFESTPPPPPKRLRHFKSTPQEAERGFQATVSKLTLLRNLNDDRVFETRLGDDKTIAFLFAPLVISFQNFFTRFCEVWRKDTEEMDVEDVKVTICIPGTGQYQLCFGVSRQRSWLHIMNMAEISPDSSILVTVIFDQCASYCEDISTK